ncbi:MarR family transcriptional regulator, partial [Mycobacterium malmoense]|uniref:MarR family winged helix-turn-helix transcriptional regulator n=1 Tax=Mycobacterium malmoense TaxID=1780 RepID=UPI00080BC7C7
MAAPTAPEIDPLALQQQVCFALSVTNRAVLAVYRPLLEPLGLTHPQYLVMLTLWDHQKAATPQQKPLSVKEIATTLQMDSATLSPMLKRLEALGLITRTRSAVDERSTDVKLTDSGTALRRRAVK